MNLSAIELVRIPLRGVTQLPNVRWGFETTSIRISEINTVRQTDIVRARRDQSLIDPMMAQVALLSDSFMLIKINGVIGAGFNTCLTAGAPVIIHDHNAIGSLGNRLFRTRVGTGWIITMPALIDPVNEIELPVNHLGAVFRDRDKLDAVSGTVFLFAGDFTGFASPAGFVVDDQGIGSHEPSP